MFVPDQEQSTRYSADQLVEAIGRARGESRSHLVAALTYFPGPEREGALVRILDAELRPEERYMTRSALARLRPERYLRPLVVEGLRSRSINVQQLVVSDLPSLLDDGRGVDVADELESWLRKRLNNPGRTNTWAVWEVPGIALSMLPSRGPSRVWELLEELSPRMQPEERARWRVAREAGDDALRIERLRDWYQECIDEEGDVDLDRDPTALVQVDRAMKRLAFSPANPASATYDEPHDDDALLFEVTVDLRSTGMRRR